MNEWIFQWTSMTAGLVGPSAMQESVIVAVLDRLDYCVIFKHGYTMYSQSIQEAEMATSMRLFMF